MNTGSSRMAPPSSSATTDKPQPTQEWKGSESRGHSQHHNGNNYFGDNLPPASGQTFSDTKSFDNSMTHNGNNIGLKVPNDYDNPPP